MSYQDIPGWFDWEDIYRRFVASAPPGAIFVEVGVAFGKSLAFLLETLEAAGRRDVRVYGVDLWRDSDRCVGEPGSPQAALCKSNGGFQGAALACLIDHCAPASAALADGRLTLCRMGSVEAAAKLSDIVPPGAPMAPRPWLVWIDADHSYDAVYTNIAAWRDFALNIGGHDYTDSFPGVKQAVGELVPDHLVEGSSWIRK